MKPQLGTAFIVFFISTSSFAQVKDYIVKTNGDTLRGELRSATSFSHEIRFRTSANDEFTVYSPDEVVSFSNKGFQRFKSIQNPKSLRKEFSQVLVEGPASLYKTATGFLVDKDQQIYLLEKKDTIFNNMSKIDRKYIGMLTVILSNCESIKAKLRNLVFLPDAMISLISSYNTCVDPAWNKKTYKARRAGRIIAGLKGGHSTSEIEFPHEKSEFHGTVFSPATAVPIGFFANIPISKRFRTQVEFVFTKKGGSSSKDVYNGSYDVPTEIKFDFTYLQIPVTFRYALWTGRFKPELFIGVAYSHTLSYEAYKRVYLRSGGTQKTSIYVSPKEIGLRGGAALNYTFSDKVVGGLEYCYENMLVDPFAGNNVFRSRAHVVSISVGYIIGNRIHD
jgi:hypothetical protein